MSGHVWCTQCKSLYPTPKGLGAKDTKAVERVRVISWAVISVQEWGQRAVGLFGCWGATGFGVSKKNLLWKMVTF